MDPTSAIPEAALRLLLDQGFDATSVDELAAAAGMSRSTFFRRFGSKESMVFADHDAMLQRVDAILESGRADPSAAVVAAALAVFDHHTARPEASLLRHRLLQEVPSLRDRELVSTHRYERAFRRGLEAAGAGLHDAGSATASAAVAFPAGVVAVHNAHLRRWLREQDPSVRSDLVSELGELARLFGPSLPGPAEPALFAVQDAAPSASAPGARPPRAPSPRPKPAGVRPAVVVTVLDPSAGTEAILDSVRRALGA